MQVSELYMRQSDMVIVGGVDTLNDILMYMCFSKTPALSPSAYWKMPPAAIFSTSTKAGSA